MCYAMGYKMSHYAKINSQLISNKKTVTNKKLIKLCTKKKFVNLTKPFNQITILLIEQYISI